MSRTSRFLTLAAASTLAVSGLVTSDAQACGGCFHEPEPQGPEISVVTGHRMAFAISPTQTVLWDQIDYTGNPKKFAWVLPIKPGARLELASDSWFSTLDAATSTRVVAPTVNCAPFNNFPGGDFEGDGDGGSFSCCMSSASDSGSFDGAVGGGFEGVPNEPPPPPPVTVVNRETVGPYEVVTLHSNVQGEFVNWLQMNGFVVDDGIQPIIDQYSSEGFDFIAMRLDPTFGIQSMKPVRVISPGASPALPLRMVAAGTGAETAVTLFVIGEGRWEAENFPNVGMYTAALTWDFATSSSDYSLRRVELLAQNEGRSWLASYARLGGLLSPINNSLGVPPTYQTNGGTTASTIAQFFTQTAFENSETTDFSCADKFGKYAESMDMVVDLCTVPNMPCADAMPGQIDSREFECAGSPDQPDVLLDDLAVAMLGQHPGSVWLTRLEGNLSRKALETDLILAPEEKQAEVDNWITPIRKANVPCVEVAPAGAIPPDIEARHARRTRREFATVVLGLFGLGLALARRAAKSLRLSPARA